VTPPTGRDPRVLAVEHFFVFERGTGGGNPCPIVVDADGLSTDDMQRLTAQFQEESGFICHDADGALRFRFFMPRQEVPMCVHATVAAATALVAAGRVPGVGEVAVRTGSGECAVSWDGGKPPRVTVEQQRPRFGDAADVAGRAEEALGLEPGTVDRAQPVRSVSVSTPKLLVPLRRADDVHRSVPDLEMLARLSEELETTGAYVFAPHPDGRPPHFVARQFPLGGGVAEDAATGVAAGALAAHVADLAGAVGPTWISVVIDQGDAMGCPCTLEAAAYADAGAVLRTTVTGSASLAREERLVLSRACAG
jgi:PhzF family phenazine biosynthesis protein